jgi:hypothetical protein
MMIPKPLKISFFLDIVHHFRFSKPSVLESESVLGVREGRVTLSWTCNKYLGYGSH